jgi:tRNA(fMet)-specific endonuclease VapC
MSYLLDTNVCSAHLRRPAGLQHRFIQHSGRLFTSSVVVAELYVWAYLRDDPTRLLSAIKQLLRDEVSLLPFDDPCAEELGKLHRHLRDKGHSVSPFDLTIAATALVHDLTLVTHNTADFQHIPGLRLENWLMP